MLIEIGYNEPLLENRDAGDQKLKMQARLRVFFTV